MIDTTMTPWHPGPSRFKRWLLSACLCVAALVTAIAPSAALAQDDEIKQDARLEGYTGNVSVPNDSTALMWLLFVFLGVLALMALFKDAKRTHLD